VNGGLAIERQKPLPVVYRDVPIDCAYRMDFVVNVLSYLRLYNRPVGLMINFNVKWLSEEGVHRFVHNFPER